MARLRLHSAGEADQKTKARAAKPIAVAPNLLRAHRAYCGRAPNLPNLLRSRAEPAEPTAGRATRAGAPFGSKPRSAAGIAARARDFSPLRAPHPRAP